MKARELPVALLISFALHGVLIAGGLAFLYAGPAAQESPDNPVTVELVMEEFRGASRPEPLSPPPPPPERTLPIQASPVPALPSALATPTRPTAQPLVDKPPGPGPEVPGAAPADPSTPQVQAQVLTAPDPAIRTADQPVPRSPSKPPAVTEIPPDEARSPHPPATDAARPARHPVAEARETPAPTAPQTLMLSLRGMDRLSDAFVVGDTAIPAKPDAVFHNRLPDYPSEAAERGQHGRVVLRLHIAPSGRAEAVDVVDSSGYALLDGAARDAVITWRFLPAMRDGHPVASDMTLPVVFDNE